MDLTLTQEQVAIRDRAAAFSSAQARPLWDRFESDDRAIMALAGGAKAAGLFDSPGEGPEGELDLTTLTILVEELAWGEGGLALLFINKYLCRRAARMLGDADASRRATERLESCEHEIEAVLLWPETSGGESALHAQSMIDSGQETLRINSKGTMARPETRALLGTAPIKPGDGAYGFYMLDLGDAEAGVGRRETLGLKAIASADVELEKSVGAGDIISEFKDYDSYREFWRDLEGRRRLMYSAALVGMARAAFEYALEYSKERMAFGKPISQHQAVGLKLADMATNIDAARLMVWRASETEGGGPDQERVEAAWLYAKEVSIDVAIEAVQVLGGHGYLKLHPVEKWMRDIQSLRVSLKDSDSFSEGNDLL